MPIGHELQLSIEGCTTPDTTTVQPGGAQREPEPTSILTSEPAPQPVLVTAAAPTCNYASCYGNAAQSQPTSSGGCGSDNSGGGCASNDSSSSNGGCGSGDSRSSSGGCDSHDDSQSSSSGSCNDSSGSSQSSSSGSCEGDTTDDHSSSCTVAPPKLRHAKRGHRHDPFVGTGLPLVLVCWLQQQRARRLRQAQGVYRAARAV